MSWLPPPAPPASPLGSPVSGLLLDASNPFGLHPWQWLFVVEGVAASVVGVIAYFYLTDRIRPDCVLGFSPNDGWVDFVAQCPLFEAKLNSL